jgi:hypothetical protein
MGIGKNINMDMPLIYGMIIEVSFRFIDEALLRAAHKNDIIDCTDNDIAYTNTPTSYSKSQMNMHQNIYNHYRSKVNFPPSKYYSTD